MVSFQWRTMPHEEFFVIVEVIEQELSCFSQTVKLLSDPTVIINCVHYILLVLSAASAVIVVKVFP